MPAYSGNNRLLTCLQTIEDFSNEIDWSKLEEVDEGLYQNLSQQNSEAYNLLNQVQEIVYAKKQPIYSVRQVCADDPSKCFDIVLRLDSLVEQYPFLTEALTLCGLDEISFLDKNSLTSVQIKKVE